MLRDNEKWKIPSYFMKVVAFWLVEKHPNLSYWDKSKLGELFLEVSISLMQILMCKCFNIITILFCLYFFVGCYNAVLFKIELFFNINFLLS